MPVRIENHTYNLLRITKLTNYHIPSSNFNFNINIHNVSQVTTRTKRRGRDTETDTIPIPGFPNTNIHPFRFRSHHPQLDISS